MNAKTAAFHSESLRPTGRFLSESWAALAFGFLMAFCSSPGQTFFIGLFGAGVRAELAMTDGLFGTIYSAATLAAAAALLFIGKLVDRLRAPVIAAMTVFWLAGAAVLMATATDPILLGSALFALRLGGQGMMSHIALTSMGRWFGPERGRAVAIATLGFPAAEALLPALVIHGLQTVGGGAVWWAIAAALVFAMGPIIVALAGSAENAVGGQGPKDKNLCPAQASRSWTRAQVLRDPRFYALCPGVLASPFIVTGLFFHQSRLLVEKDWSAMAFASAFPLFAGAATVTGVLVGALADRFGARRLLPFYLAPLGAALLVFAFGRTFADASFGMALTGMTAGAATVLFGTIWPDLYGARHLGEVRALAMALMTAATALAPGVMGLMIDAGVDLTAQLPLFAAYVAGCIAVFFRLAPSLIGKPPPEASAGATAS